MRIFSGLQPTGRKHLGNYIGAIAQYVDAQERGNPAIFCVVDLHAISVEYDPKELRDRLYDTTAILLAAGLDPDRCVLFRQSDVHEHTELTWLLSSVCSHGDLNRMTQFKEKSAKQKDFVSAALFTYPVLQAADVLAYRAEEVPVGEDQRQHIELMREIARRFNERFGKTLVVPEHRIPEIGARVMDLQDPKRKMSTTVGADNGRVLVLDEPSGDRLRHGSAPLARQAGRHQPDRDPFRHHRQGRGRYRGRFRRFRLRRFQEGRRRRGGRIPEAGPRGIRGDPRRRSGDRANPRRRRRPRPRDRFRDPEGRARGDGRRRPLKFFRFGEIAICG